MSIQNEIAKYEEIKPLVITKQVDYEMAAEKIKDIKELRQQVEESFKPIIDKAYKAHREALSQMKKYTDPLDKAESSIKRSMSEFAQIEAKRIESERLANEAKIKAAQAKKAEELKQAGQEDLAQEVLDMPVVASKPEPVKTSGVAQKTVFKWKVTDAEKIPRSFLVIDEKAINALVRSSGKNAEKIVAGIEVYTEMSIAVSGRK